MSTSDPFNSPGGFSVGIPPELVIDAFGNIVTNVNAPNANVTANRVFANSYLYANGQPLSIGASGSNTQVQYNSNGLLGASSAFTFNSSTNLLTVTNLQVGNRANLGNVSNVVILGGTNGYFLQTDGAGNLTWAPAGNGTSSNGTPGGANTQVQFNNAGSFGGDAGFTYNSSTNLLSVDNINTGNITANYISTAWDVTANVVVANYLYGDGSNISNVVATIAATANSVAGANVTGEVNFAAVANSVAGSNVTGQVNFANVANNVAGANVNGQVANALVAGTVYTAAQPNITSVGNLTSLTVVGNTTLGNQVVANFFIGNLFGTANLARNVTLGAQPNITSVGTLTSLTVSGNTTLGNNVTANYFTGNLYGVANSAVTALTAASANQANLANIAAVANYANYTNFTENANTANIAYSIDGSNVNGQVANALVAQTVTTNAQPNITSVGTLTSLSVSGNINAGNVNSNFSGNGSRLSNLTGANVTGVVPNANYAAFSNVASNANNATTANTANTVTNASQPNITSVGTLTSLTVAGNTVTSNLFANTGTVRANILIGTLAAISGNQPNITNVGTLTTLVVAGNISAGNVNAGNLLTANYLNGELSASSSSQPNINYIGNLGHLNVQTSVPGGNGNINFNGSLNGTGLGSNISITGNLNAGNFVQANLLIGSITTSSQPNITTIGNLTSLTVVGNTNLGNVSNITITGGTNGYVLATDGTGNLSWVAQSGNGGNATPGGVNTQVQFNNNGTFAGSTSFTYDDSVKVLFVNGNGNFANTVNASTFKSNVANGTAPFVVNSATPVANLGVETAATVRNNAQPNITSLGVLSSLAVSGNLSSGNLNGGNLASANYLAGTLITAAQPNITSVGTLTSLSVNGNITAANITANTGTFAGNAAGLTNIPGANVLGIVSNAAYATNAGNAATAAQATSANTAVNVTAPSQPNITSVGTLTNLNVTGNVLAGNLNANNVVTSSNGAFYGNGVGLTTLNASNLTSGIISSSRLTGAYNISVTSANNAATVTTNAQPNITSVGTLTSLGVSGNITAANITANTGVFTGNAAGLTNIPGANITGSVANAAYATNAGNAANATTANTATTAGTVTNNAQPNITSIGTLSSLNVSGNVLAGNLNANNVVLSSNGAFFGNGSGLSNLNASNISTGIISASRLAGTYNISVNEADVANTVIQSSQPNITSVGTLTGLSVNGITNLGNVSNVKITGGTNGYVLATDGTGNLSWTAQTGGNGNGTPGGATTQIQYNQDGSFAGSPRLSWNNTSNILYVSGNATITGYVNVTVLTSNVSTGTAPFVVYSNTPVANLGVETAGTVRNAAQPNITSVGTLGNLNVSGNIVTNNFTANNNFTTNGNLITPLNVFANNGIVRGNLLTGTLTTAAQPNITQVGTLVNLSVTGNVVAGNVNAGNLLTANFILGTLTTNAQQNINYLGNIGWLNVNTSIPNSNGNITFNGSISGIGVGSNINITGNINAANFVAAENLIGKITTSAQPNITSVGTLTGLDISGPANLGNVANIKITGGTNGYVLSTDGTGNLNWIPQSNGGGGNGVPGGSNTQLQFNNNGNFGGSAQLTFNDVTNQLTLVGNANISGRLTANTVVSTVSTGTAPLVVNSTTPVANLAVETANTVRGNSQPNITSVGTLVGLNVNGHANVSSLTVDNNFTTTGNIVTNSNIFANNGLIRGNLLTGTLTTTAQPNITSVGNLISLNVVGNASAGNVNGGNLVSANFLTGTLTTNAQPNINQIGTIGYLNVDTSVANSNGNIRFNGSLSGVGAASNITITGNVNAGNYVQASLLIGSLTTSSQPNITTLGNLTSLRVLGNTDLGQVSNIKITGGTANYVLSTDGAGNLSWVPQSNGGGNANPGGPNNSIQFNDGGVLGGVAGFNFNKSSNSLSLAGNANITGLVSAQAFRSNVTTGSPPLIVNSTTTVANLTAETAETVRNASQPNITSVGTLTSLQVSGNANVVGTFTSGNITTTGTIGTTSLNVTGTALLTGNTTLGNTTVATGTKLNVVGGLNANSSGNVTLGNIANIHIFGGINGYYLQTDGAGNLTWAPGGGGGGNGTPGGSNTQVQFNDEGDFGGAAGFTFNKISNLLSVNSIAVATNLSANTINLASNLTATNVTANIISGNFVIGDGSNLTNVTSQFANIANSANSVAGANVTGEVAFANVANSVAGANVTGEVAFANTANSVAGANVTGQVGFAAVANSVAGANVNGTVANANFATNAANANFATLAGNTNFANLANTAITVTGNDQPNITSVGNLTSLNVVGTIQTGNVWANSGHIISNTITANLIAGSLITPSQPNINNLGNLTSLTVGGFTNFYDNVYVNANLFGANANITNLNSSNLTSNNANISNLGVSGNAVISGNLTVNGNLIYVNVETLAVEDPIIELQVGPNGNPPVANSGKDVGTALNYFDTDARKGFMGWDVSAQEFVMASRTEINNEVVTVLQFGNLHIGNIIGNGQALTGINGANVTGIVANAQYAETANNVNYANSANTSNVAITVSGNAQPNITSVGTLANLAVIGNVSAGNVSGTFISGTLTTNAQPNITSLGSLTGLTVNGTTNLGSNSNVKITGGALGQVLGTDGNGNLSWVTGAGAPGGPNTAIQFNDNGTFGGTAFLTFNKVTNTVQVSGNLLANGFQMGAGAFDFSYSNVYFATTNSAAPNQEILNIPVSGLAAVDYTIISTDGSIRNFVKISVVRSGTSVNYVEYSTLPVNGYTGDFTVVYNAGNITTPAGISLKFSPQTANLMTHKMMVTTYKE
jgi:hypothetical protein